MSRTGRPKEIAVTARVGLIGFGAIGAVLLVAVAVGAAGFLVFAHFAPPLGSAPAQPPPPAPRLEVNGGTDLARVRRLGEARLSGWAWADPAHTAARIPIDRAMQLRAAQGWADAEPAP